MNNEELLEQVKRELTDTFSDVYDGYFELKNEIEKLKKRVSELEWEINEMKRERGRK